MLVFNESPKYRWRKMTEEQREQARKYRKENHLPFHSPAHYEGDCGLYLITAACFEHKPIIGLSAQRMAAFESSLVAFLKDASTSVFAWTILPNHYHALVECQPVAELLKGLGQLHGKMSYTWNGEEELRGRKVWFNTTETVMKSERHFWATMNYILHNAVKHRYVARWTDWPYCSAREYLESVGREQALRTWQEYPLLDYGNDWDPPDL